MDDLDELPLSKNTKILFNLLEVRIFDLSQSLQVASHQLSINQLKQILEKQYNIFGQSEKVFNDLKISKLYELMKQVSQNYISIASILIDEKTSSMNAKYKSLQTEPLQNTNQGQSQNKPIDTPKGKGKCKQVSTLTLVEIEQSISTVLKQESLAHKKLGGIHLFNQNYVIGIQTLQNKWQAIEAKNKKKYNQKQLIKQLIFKEMNQKADVQKIHDNDEISKFIKEGKVKHELYYHIQYEKDLESISAFLKQSQIDALKFLSDTKKVNSDVQKEDDLIINYHELIQILAEKKRKQFEMIENKIKQIVQTFKTKVDFLDTQIQIKDANIRELEFKLKRREGKEIGSQTVGQRNNFNFNSTSSPEDIEEQHKAIVQMLKNNIDATQKDLLNLETDVRVKQQKIKKKDNQISVLEGQIEKYKKNLKQQKQKTLQLIREKSLPQNPFLNKQSQKLQDTQKADETQLQANEYTADDNLSRTNHRRKNKISTGNFSSSMISTDGKYRKGREESILSSGFGDANNLSRRMNSFNASSQSIPHHASQMSLLNQGGHPHQLQTHDSRQKDSEHISTERQQARHLSSILVGDRNQLIANQGSFQDQEDNLETMKRIDMQENAEISVERMAQQASQVIKSSQKGAQKMSLTKPVPKQSKKVQQSTSASHIFDNTLSTHKDPEFALCPQVLLKKNAETFYEMLFGSVESIDGSPLIVEEEINKLKQFMSRYNQRQVQSKLRRMVSFFNLSEHTQQIVEKEVSEEEDSISNNSNPLSTDNQLNDRSINRHYHSDQQNPGLSIMKEKHKLAMRVKQGKAQAQKGEKGEKGEKSSHLIDSQTLKEKRLKKLLPSSNFLNKLHNQIRISGMGFNLSKQQFISMCKDITVNESHHSSLQESQDEDHIQSNHKTTIFHKYKAKDAMFNENAQKSIYEKNREKGKSEDDKKNNAGNNETQSEIPKSHKFSITKEIEHQIRGTIPALKSNFNSANQSTADKKKQIKEFFNFLKNQGARIESLQKLQEMIVLSQISLHDILKITSSLNSQRIEDVIGLFSHRCQQSLNTNSKSLHIEPCCLHARRYEVFLEKLSISENSVRKMRKDLLEMNVFNIDGNATQKDFSKKKIKKQKSQKMNDLTNLSSNMQKCTEKPGQTDSFYGLQSNLQKKKQKCGVEKKLSTKKATASAYIEAKRRTETETNRQIERKSVGFYNLKGNSTGFLPQLGTKGISHLIRD